MIKIRKLYCLDFDWNRDYEFNEKVSHDTTVNMSPEHKKYNTENNHGQKNYVEHVLSRKGIITKSTIIDLPRQANHDYSSLKIYKHGQSKDSY